MHQASLYKTQPAFSCLYIPESANGVLERHRYTFCQTILHPQSRGHLTLHSTDLTQPPVIHANYLSDNVDLQTLIKSVKLAHYLGQTHAFASFAEAETHPSLQTQNNTEITAFLRTHVSSIYHPVGTIN